MEPLRILLSGLLIMLWPYWAVAQQADEAYVEFKDKLAQLSDSNANSALIELPPLIHAIDDKEHLAIARTELANLLTNSGQMVEADSLFSLALPSLKTAKNHHYVLRAYDGVLGIKQVMGMLKEGIALADEAQQYIDAYEQDLNQTAELRLMGNIYRYTGILFAMQMEADREGPFNQESSLKYFRKAQALFAQVEDFEMAGLSLFNIGNVQSTEDSTIYYWEKAIEVFNQNNLQGKNYQVYQNLAILYLDKKEYIKALEYLELVKENLPSPPHPYDLSLYKIKLAKTQLLLKNFDEGLANLQEGLDIALQNGMLSLEGEAYELLLQAYQELGRYREAFETYVKYDSLVKQFERAETERIFRETEARYKTKEQADEIRILEQSEALNQAKLARQRLLIIIGIVVMLLIGLVSYFLWKRGQERKQLNKKLRKLDQTRTQFLVNISHELRTPLTLVHAPLQDAIEQLQNGKLDRVDKDLKKIRNNTNKLIQLTEEVLDISKLDEGALKLELAPTNLNKFIGLVFFSFESLAVRQGLKWQYQLDLPNGQHLVDQRKLEKVLNNLLSNAIKNTPKGGTVKLVTGLENGELQMTITDTGKGIEAGKLDRIFQRYYQAGKADQESGGLGIGLAFVKELLDFMKGSISVESSPGQGTTFTVKVPITETEAADSLAIEPEDSQVSLENRPAIDLSSTDKAHVLVVEDNPEMSDFIQQLLSDQYRVTLADNGKEGIARLHSSSFDLVTADVMMPEMDGISFVKKLKAHQDWKNLPVVMITALSEETDKIGGLQLGVDDYIPKPFNANELKVRIANLLSNAQVRKETVADPEAEPIGNEEKLLRSARHVVEAHLDQNEFGVKDLAEHLNLSERQANRVLKKVTGLSCLQFIREIKVQKAYRYLEVRQYATIAEVAYAVGFENTSYFTRLFTGRFGKKPSDFLS